MRFRLLALVAAGALIAPVVGSRRDTAPPDPRLMLWAWERPVDLLDLPSGVGVAFLAQTITVSDEAHVTVQRRQPLRVDPSTYLVAVTRVEAPAGVSERRDAIAAIAADIASTLKLPRVSGVQIDFDARASQRPMYRRLLHEVRAALPPGTPLSMTALASWCLDDNWLDDLPVDEVVPMLFRMGPTQDMHRARVRNPRAAAPACRGARRSLARRAGRHLRPAREAPLPVQPGSVDARVGAGRRGGGPSMKRLPFIVLFAVVSVLACGPYINEVLPVETVRPADLAAYNDRGELGVVRPQFARRYLVQAYRRMTGREALPAVGRFGPEIDETAPPPGSEWSEVHARFAGVALPPIDTERNIGNYQWITNCLGNAFRRRGADADRARRAIRRRQSAGARMDRSARPGVQELPRREPRASRSSRRRLPIQQPGPIATYQIASAYFYAMRYDEAVQRFRGIAADRPRRGGTTATTSPAAPACGRPRRRRSSIARASPTPKRSSSWC